MYNQVVLNGKGIVVNVWLDRELLVDSEHLWQHRKGLRG